MSRCDYAGRSVRTSLIFEGVKAKAASLEVRSFTSSAERLASLRED